MPVTLAQAAQNAADDVDLAVINEFRASPLLDALVFDDAVNPAGGGATLTYSYRRLVTRGDAQFRAINAEYVPTEATTSRHHVDLKPLGGSFQIDRVLARVGPQATGEVNLQMSAKIDASKAKFADAAINGDSAVDEDSFDGLSKALAGSSTEISTGFDWSGGLDEGKAYSILDSLDTLLGQVQGGANMILANTLSIGKIKAALRRANAYTEKVGPTGEMIAQYGNVRIVDLGPGADGMTQIIPTTDGLTDVYAVRVGLDGFHGVSVAGSPLVETWLPDFAKAGAVKTGEVEMGPLAVALKATKAAAVARDVRLAPAA